jgi:hypothetical protein
MKDNKGTPGGCLVMLLILGLCALYAYMVATSGLPDWFKFWLLG